MCGEPADMFLKKKVGPRGRYFSPNQVDKSNPLNQVNQVNQLNQVNKEIDMVSISKEAQFFFRAGMHFYRPLRAAAALQREIKTWCWCSHGGPIFLIGSVHEIRNSKSKSGGAKEGMCHWHHCYISQYRRVALFAIRTTGSIC
jgi:hypothetical protein